MKSPPLLLPSTAVVQNLIILRRWGLDRRAENRVADVVCRALQEERDPVYRANAGIS